MLEILLVRFLCVKIGNLVEEKGHSRILYQILMAIFWFGGEIGGFIIGIVALEMAGAPGGDEDLCFAYIPAILGAALGTGVAFIIAAVLPDHGSRDRNEFADRAYYRDRYGAGGRGLHARDTGDEFEDERSRRRGAAGKRPAADDDAPLPLADDPDAPPRRRPVDDRFTE